jgi:hypothetical protein
VPGEPGVRLRTLADVFAYASARGAGLRLDGTEVQVRRPRGQAGPPRVRVRTEGIAGLFRQFSQVKAKVDAGYRGLAKEFPGQVQAPPLKPKKGAPPEETAAYEAERHMQSSERICVEHANAEHKQWRALQCYPGRREEFDETFLAVAGLVSDRAAER